MALCSVASLNPTRWTDKKRGMNSILENYSPLLQLLEESGLVETVSEMKARIDGIFHTMMKFEFYFAMSLSIEILGQTDELAKALQNKDLSAAEGKTLFEACKMTLKSLNSVENFNKFWEKVKKKSEELEIGQPVLPRKRKMPARYWDEQNDPDFPQTPKEHYHKIYQKAIENSENCLEERFNQKGFEMYVQIQNLLLFAADKQDYEQELKQVLDFYKDDFDEDGLRLQLKIV